MSPNRLIGFELGAPVEPLRVFKVHCNTLKPKTLLLAIDVVCRRAVACIGHLFLRSFFPKGRFFFHGAMMPSLNLINASFAMRAWSGLKQMILVMHWAVKSIRMKRLSEAKSISLSVDDRKDYRLLRYRCNLPCPASKVQSPQSTGGGPSSLEEWCEAPPLIADGLLGVYRTGQDVPENTLEAHDADKSIAMAKTVHELISRACMDPDGQLDQVALDLIKSNIRHFASDQGPSVSKCGKVLASDGQLGSLVYCSFDAAHQVRIGCKDPLQALPGFEAQWKALFGGKEALLPSIQNSDVWTARLLAAQQKVLEMYGRQGMLEKTLKTFSFAPQRFDSAASPLLKYCCLIRAIAVLCGMQAADVLRFCFSFFH